MGGAADGSGALHRPLPGLVRRRPRRRRESDLNHNTHQRQKNQSKINRDDESRNGPALRLSPFVSLCLSFCASLLPVLPPALGQIVSPTVCLLFSLSPFLITWFVTRFIRSSIRGGNGRQ